MILFFMPDDFIQDYLGNTPLQQFGSDTVTDKNQLYVMLEQARKDGYTVIRF